MAGSGGSNFNRQQRNKRIAAQLPVAVGKEQGSTRDISATGMFVIMSNHQEMGSLIDFTVNLDTSAGKVTLHCKGEIVRVEDVNGRLGVGIKVNKQSGKQLLFENLGVAEMDWDKV